ncbi:MAG: sulfite exporter TauE/SafE family protein, partial [Saprospiraceae bacterium]
MTLTVEWPMIFAAFLLGLASSIHCIGMCGPLVLMLPFGNTGDGKSLLRFFLYGISKAGVYGMFGLFFGLFGWGIKYASSQM